MSEVWTRRWLALTGLLLVVALAVAALRHQQPALVTLPRAASAPPMGLTPTRAVVPALRRHGRPVAPPAARRRHRQAGLRRATPPAHVAGALLTVVDDVPMVIDGPPSVSPALIDATLRREGSPLAGLGRYIYAAGRRNRIDPVFLLAFVSYFDVGSTLPAAAHNVGHIRPSGTAPALDGYRAFPSWHAGIDAWYGLIRAVYVRRWGLRTLDSILPVYAPGTGRRSVEAELNSMRAMVSAWRMASRQ